MDDSSIANIVADAEKLGPGLAPAGDLSRILGVLALHVEQLAGKALEPLADEVLGIAAPEPQPPGSESPETATRIAELEAENARLKGAPAPGAGSA